MKIEPSKNEIEVSLNIENFNEVKEQLEEIKRLLQDIKNLSVEVK